MGIDRLEGGSWTTLPIEGSQRPMELINIA